MSVQPSVKNVRVGGVMVAKPINVRVSSAWKAFANTTGELYLSPTSGGYHIGDTVTMAVRENSFTTAVNSVQANLTYNASVLQFQSSDISASPFEISVQNTGGSGTIQIALGSFDGSVTGDQLVSTVTFTVLATGTAAVAFTTGSGIARTSDSSDICNQKLGASYTAS